MDTGENSIGGASIEDSLPLTIIREQSTTQMEQNFQQADLQAQQDMAFYALLMVIATGITVVLTAIGIWLLKRTLDATLEAVEDTGKATEAMLDANELATKSADAAIEASALAREANAIAVNANQQQLRAWINFNGIKPILNNLGPANAMQFANDFAGVDLLFVNTGQSPALRVKTHCDALWVPNLDAGVPHFDGQGQGQDDVPYVGTFVGRDRPLVAPRKILEGDAARRWLNGEGCWVVYVKIEYEDIFSGEHITELCMLLQALNHIMTPRGLEPQFVGRPLGDQNRMT